jgi:hypothetical protein
MSKYNFCVKRRNEGGGGGGGGFNGKRIWIGAGKEERYRLKIQTFQLSRFYQESPENSCNLLVSRFLSNSPDFSEYSGNIVKKSYCF